MSKRGFFIWLFFALVSAAIGFTASRLRKARLEKAEHVFLRHYQQPEQNHVVGIEDTTLAAQYIQFEKDTATIKPIKFKFVTMRTDGVFYALQYTRDSTLVLVARKNDKPTGVNPAYQELWIWNKHVLKQKSTK